MREDLVIRRFTVGGDGVAALTLLLRRAYAPLAAGGMKFVATWQGPDITLNRIRESECYIALQGDRLVGTINFKAPATTRGCGWYDRPEVASFGQFGVEPDLQGAGVGRALLSVVEARAIEVGAAELALDTAEPAAHLQALYRRWGYRRVGWADWEETNYRSVIMSKALPRGFK